jgi:hypothetical protein
MCACTSLPRFWNTALNIMRWNTPSLLVRYIHVYLTHLYLKTCKTAHLPLTLLDWLQVTLSQLSDSCEFFIYIRCQKLYTFPTHCWISFKWPYRSYQTAANFSYTSDVKNCTPSNHIAGLASCDAIAAIRQLRIFYTHQTSITTSNENISCRGGEKMTTHNCISVLH